MVFADGTPFPPGCDFDLVDDAPDVIVLGGVGDWLSKEALNTVIGFAADGVPLIAMHRNLCWQTPQGLALDLGGLLPGIEAASGRASYLIGKPSPAFFERAMETAGMDPARALMVGDDIATDVLAAQDLGLTGVLVRTGKFREETLDGRAPDFVIDSIADLPGLLQEGK
jgi:HAD superfamily hydrolase (TIGR01450 family)